MIFFLLREFLWNPVLGVAQPYLIVRFRHDYTNGPILSTFIPRLLAQSDNVPF